jgi:hypothetical protein
MSRLTVSFGKAFTRESQEAAEQASHNLHNRIAQVVAKPSSTHDHSVPPLESRRGRRFTPRYPKSSLTMSNGEKHDALILNVSRFGVLVSADFQSITPNDVVRVGSTDVNQVRRVHRGAAFAFTKQLNASACDELLIL